MSNNTLKAGKCYPGSNSSVTSSAPRGYPGTPQGGEISPLLANIALHGLEAALVESLPQSRKPAIIRYADDFVILHEDLATLLKLKKQAEEWLATMGLNLKTAKTRITHTLDKHEGNVGFDFLGFTVRQYPMSKRHARLGFKTFFKPSKVSQQRHLVEMAEVIHNHRGSNQTALLTELNPKVRGWTNSGAHWARVCTAKKVFDRAQGPPTAKCTGNCYVGPNDDTRISTMAGVVTTTGDENANGLISVTATPPLSSMLMPKFAVMLRCKEPKALSMVIGLTGCPGYTKTLLYPKELFSC